MFSFCSTSMDCESGIPIFVDPVVALYLIVFYSEEIWEDNSCLFCFLIICVFSVCVF